jgi:hypothetical protein
MSEVSDFGYHMPVVPSIFKATPMSEVSDFGYHMPVVSDYSIATANGNI